MGVREKSVTKRKNENEIILKKTFCIGVGVNYAV